MRRAPVVEIVERGLLGCKTYRPLPPERRQPERTTVAGSAARTLPDAHFKADPASPGSRSVYMARRFRSQQLSSFRVQTGLSSP
jgi:hypothetical protein